MTSTDKKIVTKKENPLINLGINIIIPALIMIKGVKWFGLSGESALILALIFPLIYGVYDFFIEKKWNFFSILGFISILLTGGIGLLKISKDWVAWKEAAVPFVIGMVVFFSLKTRYPLVKTLLYNEKVINVERVDEALRHHHKKSEFEGLLRECTWLITLSFMMSAVLNFVLAKMIIVSETGTEAFTEELGKLTALSYPIIAIPCTIVMIFALFRLFGGIKKLTGLELEDVFQQPAKKS